MTRLSRSGENPLYSDEQREEPARRLAEGKARRRKITPAQELNLMRKTEKHPLPDWLKPYRKNLQRFAILTYEGGSDSTKVISCMRVVLNEDRLDVNRRHRFYQELDRFMSHLEPARSDTTERRNVDCCTTGGSTHRTTSYSNNR